MLTSAIASASCARSPPGSSRLATRHAQPVADVAYCLDRVRLAFVAELASQVADVDLQHFGARVEVKAPDRVEELLAGEDLVGVAHQILEHLELTRGQLHITSIALHTSGAKIHANARDLQHRGLALGRWAQLGAHPREQLL